MSLSVWTDLQINSLSPCDVQNRWFFFLLLWAEEESFWLAVQLLCLCCMLTASAEYVTQVVENLTLITRLSHTGTVGRVRTAWVGKFRQSICLDHCFWLRVRPDKKQSVSLCFVSASSLLLFLLKASGTSACKRQFLLLNWSEKLSSDSLYAKFSYASPSTEMSAPACLTTG